VLFGDEHVQRYDEYEQKTDRDIPVVVFERAA
jgi:hypothetical protein